MLNRIFLGLFFSIMYAIPAKAEFAFGVFDAKSEKVVVESNLNAAFPAGNLSLLLVIYIACETLDRGEIKFTDKVKISENAAIARGRKSYLQKENYITVKEALTALVVHNSMDAAVALAEHIAGTTDNFVSIMNQQSKILGMQTTFIKPFSKEHDTTTISCQDISKIAFALIKKHPKCLNLFTLEEYKAANVNQLNHNEFIYLAPNYKGFITATTNKQFHGIIWYVDNNYNLLSICLGADSAKTREYIITSGIDSVIKNFESFTVFPKNTTITTTKVWYGNQEYVNTGVVEDINLVIPKDSYHLLDVVAKFNNNIEAPVDKGAFLGLLEFYLNEQLIESFPLVSLDEVKKGKFYSQMLDFILLQTFQSQNILENYGIRN